MSENKEQQEYFNAILQEYNTKLARTEHENILLRVENANLIKKLQELQQGNEKN